ncbi:MAG: DNA-directed RNA polymerase subunit alpha C-terminal domain-containing protein [Candidatus Uhrbacteria bacterium]
MSRPEKGTAHKQRWPLIKQLLSLGLSAEEIAGLVTVSAATIRLDIRQYGNVTKLLPNRPKKTERFQTVFKRFSQLMFENESDQTEEYQALWQWLKIDGLLQLYVLGLVRMIETLSLPRVSPEQEPYLRLMIRVFDLNVNDVNGSKSSNKTEQILRLLCSKVDQGQQIPPNSTKELQELLLQYTQCYLEADRRLCLAWPKNVHILIDQALATLPPREGEVLRLRFGIGHDAAMSLEKIGQKFYLSLERIRQIESKGLKKLRHLVKKEPLCFLWQASNFECLLDLKRHIRVVGQHESESLFETERLNELTLVALAEILTTPLDEFEMNVRPINCFHHRGWRYLFELVLHNESELLKTKNFGRRSLNETKEILACFSEEKRVQIKLGMVLPPELIAGLQMWKILRQPMRRLEIHYYETCPKNGDLSAPLDSRLKNVGLVYWHELLSMSQAELSEKVPDFSDQDLKEINLALDVRCRGGGLHTYTYRPRKDTPPDIPVPSMSIEMDIPAWIQNLL